MQFDTSQARAPQVGLRIRRGPCVSPSEEDSLRLWGSTAVVHLCLVIVHTVWLASAWWHVQPRLSSCAASWPLQRLLMYACTLWLFAVMVVRAAAGCRCGCSAMVPTTEADARTDYRALPCLSSGQRGRRLHRAID